MTTHEQNWLILLVGIELIAERHLFPFWIAMVSGVAGAFMLSWYVWRTTPPNER